MQRSDGGTRRRGTPIAVGWACLAAVALAGCAAQVADSAGPSASAQAQAVADAYVVRANAAVDSGRTLQQAVGDAQSTSQQALGGFVTRPLSGGEVSSEVSRETIAVVNERGVCYSFTLTVGPTRVSGSSVTVMDACPPSSS